MASNDISDWYRSIPQITRYWFTGSVIIPLLGRIGLVSPFYFILDWTHFIWKFQIWRPLTSALYYPIAGPSGFQFLINLYFLYSYSSRLESETFAGVPADHFFMLTFNWLCLVIIGLITGLPLLMEPLILSVVYVWCQLNKDQIVRFWFGTQFKAMYLPWILLAFNFITGRGGMLDFFGIVAGHLYFFLMFKYPQDFGGVRLLSVPQFLYKLFPNRRQMGGFGQAPASRQQQQQQQQQQPGNNNFWRRHDWGQGNVLGEN